MRGWALLTMALLGLGAAPAPTSSLTVAERDRIAASPAIGRNLVRALDSEEKVRVIIAFSVPQARGRAPRDLAAPAAREAIASIADRILGSLLPAEFELRRRYRSINAIAGSVRARGLVRLLEHPEVLRVDLDEGGAGGLAEAVPLVGLDLLHGVGLAGRGATVAVIDSGVDTDHPDLAEAVVAQRCFCETAGGCCPPDGRVSGRHAQDDNGHGTNVSGIVASNGTIAPTGGAPDVRIVAVKVLASDNTFCCTSDLLAALDWIIEHRPDVDVVNTSLGTFQLFEGDCDGVNALTIAAASAVDTLRARGVLTFASAMNGGSSTAMALPACLSNVISVGAVYDSALGPVSFPGVCTDAATAADQLACWSNRSETTDVVAPGAFTTSSGIGGSTSTFFGTSMASPLAAACAATLRGAVPDATPDEIEQALEGAPSLVSDPASGRSYPRVDCAESLVALGCGDGSPDPDESCDDGNLRNGDGCDANCTPTGCGNGIVTAPEECDDGNLVGGDGCEADCARTPFVGISGRRIALRDREERPARRRLFAASRDQDLTAPARGSAGDPTVGGAVLRIGNPTTGESVAIDLPASRWRPIGAEGLAGYRYRDRMRRSGPCTRVAVKRIRPSLRLRCRGADLPFTLDEPLQGSVAVSLSLGTSEPYCMEFGGEHVLDFGIGASSGAPRIGRFKRRDSVPPGLCPIP